MASFSHNQIDAMPYRELQKECRKAGLSATGKTEALRKRLREARAEAATGSKPDPPAMEDSGAPPAAKRQKKVEDDLICPITLELPFDPVMAEDGRVYERSAIEQHIKNNNGRILKSPFTMETMGTRLLPAIQTKNIIKTSIENGTITGDLASKWKEKDEQKKKMESLVKMAEEGVVCAMELVAVGYDCGTIGLVQDDSIAYKWYQKVHAAGSILGMAKEGEFLIKGIGGVTKDVKKGLTYLGMAEGRGSDLAACFLGYLYAVGAYGVPLDEGLARRFLEKALSGDCQHQVMGEACREDAQKILDKLVDADGS